MAKKVDYKKKSDKDLHIDLAEAYRTLGNARFGAAGGRSKNTPEGKKAKKIIARIKTELRRREIEEILQNYQK